MRKFERYWMNAMIYLLLGESFSGNDQSLFNSVAIVSCYALSAGYFFAMMIAHFKGESK